MTSQGIIPLFKQFREGQLPGDELLEKMDGVIQFCERKIASLERTQIQASDKAEWDEYLRPALELSYKGLIGAAMLCKEYVREQSQEIAEGIVFAFVQVDKLNAFIEQRAGNVSTQTQSLIQSELSQLSQDASQVQNLQNGIAQTEVSLFDD